MECFIGNIDAKADAKGRVFIPAVFRKVLNESGEGRLVLRKDVHQDCLVLYPYQAWNEELGKLRQKLNRYNKMHQTLLRQLVMDTEIIEMDQNGRVLIPKRYLSLIDVSSEMRFVGMDDTIEIWNCSKLEESLLEAEAFEAGISEILGGIDNE